ncbi:winged helix-turn-helix domain-containing protein [Halorarum salinum]|uniref:Winged helix-turn-helix transcriptional regulator n=1 Tax=Halorarum salinum TaxID=2743089 RepID=A0A7D5QI88_9EURY|nr:winged helix-turn-helix domain-containing protein [Halobaculum salinum]QLG60485.1 winged helix-turn-helix transcriptional regulator [Halobaculum salinum]
MTGGDESVDDEEFFALLDDPYARAILVEIRDGPRSADDLTEVVGASPSTVYRRIERLRDQGLVEGEHRLDPDGHHHEVYTARLERVTVELTATGFEIDVDRTTTADAADRFTNLYEELSNR